MTQSKKPVYLLLMPISAIFVAGIAKIANRWSVQLPESDTGLLPASSNYLGFCRRHPVPRAGRPRPAESPTAGRIGHLSVTALTGVDRPL